MSERPRALAWAVSRWNDEPWTVGGWSLLRPGGSDDTRRALGAPIGSRLVLAGEATNPTDAGMVHGAAEEGRRAAAWCVAQGHRKVVVVGAGAAGLAAARALHDEVVEVVVVEARDRIGGRVRTEDLHGIAVELGANWLQQGERNSLRPLARELGLTLVATDFHAPVVHTAAGIVDTSGDEAVVEALRQRVAAVGESDRPLGDVVDELLADPAPFTAEQVARVVDAEVYLDAGAPLGDLSARYGFEPGVGEGDEWIVGGYVQVLDALAEEVLILEGWPVTRVEVGEHQATVRGPAGHVDGDAVIVTVPVSVLQGGGIEFRPPLPEGHRAALDLMTMGRVEKVALRFAERWWAVSPSNYLRIHGDRPGEVCEWLDATDVHGAPVIVGLFVGPWVPDLWDGHTDAEVARGAIEILARAR